jgi:hypothetical protein
VLQILSEDTLGNGIVRACLWSILLGIFAAPASGQETEFTVRGMVIDTVRGDPVPGVLLRLDVGPKVISDRSGGYEFRDLPDGSYEVAVVTPDCQVSFGSFESRAASRVFLVFQVPPTESTNPLPPSVPLPGSKVLNAAEIEDFHVTTLADLLQRVSPGLIRSTPGQPGQQSRIRSRGVASVQGPLSPILVLDGVNLGPMESEDMLDMVKPPEIAFLEIYRGASGGWSYGTGASGGVIRITRKKGGESPPPDLDPERCPIPGWKNQPGNRNR